MMTKSALLAVSCGVQQKYILQVMETCQEQGKLRMFLSDGNTFMCAETDNRKELKLISQYSLVRVELHYTARDKPLTIRSIEVVEQNYKFLFGNPIPFIDYIRNGCIGNHEESDDPLKRTRIKSTSNKKQNQIEAQQKKQKDIKPMLLISQIEEFLGENGQDTIIHSAPKPPHIIHIKSDEEYVMISDLYIKMKNWKILGRISWIDSKLCLNKNGIKQDKQILVINFFVMDSNKKEIKCSCFSEAAYKFKDVLKKNRIYEFSNGTLLEEVSNSQSSTNGKSALSIRFETYSKIIEKENANIEIPINSYNLISFDKLAEYDKEFEIDVAGIIKSIQKIADVPNSTKKKVTFLLVCPTTKKEIEALIFLEPEEVQSIVQYSPIILKKVKIDRKQDEFIFIKSYYNTQVLTEFEDKDEKIKDLLAYSKQDILGMDFETLSEIKYYHRSFDKLLNLLEIVDNEQKLYSKTNCYFMGTFGEKKYYYDACYKCSKKVSYVSRANYCQKCKKVVDIKEQYVVKAMFVDCTRQIKLTLVGDYAKYLLKMNANQFVKMNTQDQLNHINSLKFTEVCLYLKSIKQYDSSINHNVQHIEKPHNEQVSLINKIVERNLKLESMDQ